MYEAIGRDPSRLIACEQIGRQCSVVVRSIATKRPLEVNQSKLMMR